MIKNPLKKCIILTIIDTAAVLNADVIKETIFKNTLYKDLLIILPVIIFLSIIAISLLFMKWKNDKLNMDDKETIVETYKRLSPRSKFLFLIPPLMVGLIVGYGVGSIIIPKILPNYEIIIPRNNISVDLIITVGGHGAIPGSEINVFVVDDYGNRWPQGTTFSDTRGNWRLNPVYIGRPDDRDKGKIYVIYALMTTQGGMKYSSNEVRVKRK